MRLRLHCVPRSGWVGVGGQVLCDCCDRGADFHTIGMRTRFLELFYHGNDSQFVVAYHHVKN